MIISRSRAALVCCNAELGGTVRTVLRLLQPIEIRPVATA